MPKKIKIVGLNGPEVIKVKKDTVILDNEKTNFFLSNSRHKKTLEDLSRRYKGDELFMRASNYYRQELGAPPLRAGEYHFGSHNFLGPGTRLDSEGLSRKPFNKVDSLAKEHDLLPKNKMNSRMLLNKLKKINPQQNGYHVLREMLEREILKN